MSLNRCKREISVTKAMLYSRRGDFKNFENITPEDMKRILDFAKMKLEDFKGNGYSSFKTISSLYRETIEGLVQSSIYHRLHNFDEKIFFLINVVDPHLKVLEATKGTKVYSEADIKKYQSEQARAIIREFRNRQLHELQSKMIDTIGFYDEELAKYEEIYRKKFVKKIKFAENVKMSMLKQLFNSVELELHFDKISPERYHMIEEYAKRWYIHAKDPSDANSLCYSMFRQTELLPVKNLEEMMTLFILSIDPKLDAIRIYEEEAIQDRIVERITNEFGFYSNQLIRAEQGFHKQFMPERVVSAFSKKQDV